MIDLRVQISWFESTASASLAKRVKLLREIRLDRDGFFVLDVRFKGFFALARYIVERYRYAELLQTAEVLDFLFTDGNHLFHRLFAFAVERECRC